MVESVIAKRLNEEGNDPETWKDSDYGTTKSVTRNKRNRNQAKLVTNQYPDGIYLEKDGWDNWVEIDKPSNFVESVSRIPNRRLNEGLVDIADMSDYYPTAEVQKFEKLLLAIAKNGLQKSFNPVHGITEFIMELSDENEPGLKDWLRTNGLQIMYKSNGGIVITSKDFNSY